MIEYGNSHPHSGSGIDGYRSPHPALKWLVGLFVLLLIVAIGFGIWHSRTDTRGQTAATSAPTFTAAVPSATPALSATPTPVAQTVSISAVGDLMCHNRQLKSAWNANEQSYSFDDYYTYIAPYIQASDFAFGNLETVLEAPGASYSGFPHFNSPKSFSAALQAAGFDLLTAANNHIYDHGFPGITSTLQTLSEQQIPCVGIHADRNEPSVQLQSVQGFSVCVLAYTQHANQRPAASHAFAVNMYSEEKAKADIQAARQQGANIVIVSLHWGAEYSRTPSQTAMAQARMLLQSGADAVIGSHPHVLQPMEWVEWTDESGQSHRGLVAYSLGNFIHNQVEPHTDAGAIVQMTFSRDADGQAVLQSARYVPTYRQRKDVDGDGLMEYRVLPIGHVLDHPEHYPEVSQSERNILQRIWIQTTQLLGTEDFAAVRSLSDF